MSKVKDVIVVDDDEDFRKIARKILEGSGYKVVECTSIADTMEEIKENPPHLMLVDIKMPSTGGLEFLHWAKKTKAAHFPIIVASGLKNEEIVNKAISLGACDYIIKPVNAKLLTQKVKKHLKEHGFHGHSFTETERPNCKATIKGVLRNPTTSGLEFQGAVKLAPNSLVEIQSEDIDIGDIKLKSSRINPSFLENRSYLSFLRYAGLTPTQQKIIINGFKKIKEGQ